MTLAKVFLGHRSRCVLCFKGYIAISECITVARLYNTKEAMAKAGKFEN